MPTSTARALGAIICVVLALLELAWMIRDFRGAGLHDTVWTWFGGMLPGQHHGILATSAVDVVLLVVYAVAGLTATKPAGRSALATAAALTLAYRTPTVWMLGADWAEGAPDRTLVLVTAVAEVLGAVYLIIAALVAGRPAGAPAAPPRPGPAVCAGVLLAVFGVVGAAWQLWDMREFTAEKYGPLTYWHMLTGEHTISALLAPAPAWSGWATAVLCVLTAVQAFVRTPLARTMGMALGGTLIVFGTVALVQYHTEHIPFTLHHAATNVVLQRLTLLLEIAVGVVALLLLAIPDLRPVMTDQPGRRPPAQAYGGWNPPAP
ncbi:hypothetical protein ABT288_23655 [Streptomyces sp. NPDC001093]|uniref:hypothetical protein n=1 Tax=Streptomyces sp. NPDC001093 TaxID=3154376 RepID=UPI00332A162F